MSICKSIALLKRGTCLVILFSWSLVYAGTPETQETSEVEKIKVEGKKTRLYYLHRLRDAEEAFYDAFNAINDIDKFRMICRLERRTGSNIKIKRCYPQYLLTRWAQETQGAMGGRNLGQLARSAIRLPTIRDIQFLVERDKEESLAHTEKLVKENPELLKKLITLEEKRLAYEKASGKV